MTKFDRTITTRKKQNMYNSIRKDSQGKVIETTIRMFSIDYTTLSTPVTINNIAHVGVD